jgi:hypothetical protein
MLLVHFLRETLRLTGTHIVVIRVTVARVRS